MNRQLEVSTSAGTEDKKAANIEKDIVAVLYNLKANIQKQNNTIIELKQQIEMASSDPDTEINVAEILMEKRSVELDLK